MKLSVYATPFRSEDYARLSARFIEESLQKGIAVSLAPSTLHALEQMGVFLDGADGFTVASEDSVDDDTDFAVSLGGDGTFLRAAHWCGEKPVPIVGVNLGHLGYLPAYNPDDLPTLADTLKNADYDVESRSLLLIELPDGFKDSIGACWRYALNEVAIVKQDTASMISVPVTLNGREMGVYNADGLIISTPTGSTAYNLSVGGPVLQPVVPALVLSPIADHSLTMRPMVIAEDSVIDVTAVGRINSFRVSLDGNSFTLPMGTPVRVVKAPFCCRIIVRKGTLFSSTLRSKLLWGETTPIE